MGAVPGCAHGVCRFRKFRGCVQWLSLFHRRLPWRRLMHCMCGCSVWKFGLRSRPHCCGILVLLWCRWLLLFLLLFLEMRLQKMQFHALHTRTPQRCGTSTSTTECHNHVLCVCLLKLFLRCLQYVHVSFVIPCAVYQDQSVAARIADALRPLTPTGMVPADVSAAVLPASARPEHFLSAHGLHEIETLNHTALSGACQFASVREACAPRHRTLARVFVLSRVCVCVCVCTCVYVCACVSVCLCSSRTS